MGSQLEAAIEAFIEAQRIDRGSSERTIEAYRRDLRQLSDWLGTGCVLAGIEASRLDTYLAHLSDTGQKPSSIARKTSAIRQFFKFCCLERGLRENPAERLASPAQEQRLPKCLSQEQVNELLAAAERGLPYLAAKASADEAARELAEHLRARDRAMVYLLYATGLRVSELIGLTTHDVDLELGYVRVTGKGDKQRIAPFAPVAGEKLHTYLKSHRPRLEPGTDHVFVNQNGLALTRQAFWKLLKDLALQAGVPSSLSPHVLRHSFATHLLQSGMNLRSLQTLLGHSDLATTQIYTHVEPGHLKEAHRKFHPRGGG